jgi:hypothetical protein
MITIDAALEFDGGGWVLLFNSQHLYICSHGASTLLKKPKINSFNPQRWDLRVILSEIPPVINGFYINHGNHTWGRSFLGINLPFGGRLSPFQAITFARLARSYGLSNKFYAKILSIKSCQDGKSS